MQSTDPGAAAVAALLGITSDSAAAWTMFMGSIALELAGMIAMMRDDAPVASRITALSSVPRPIVGVPRLEPPTLAPSIASCSRASCMRREARCHGRSCSLGTTLVL
jgi:hypothetical protein